MRPNILITIAFLLAACSSPTPHDDTADRIHHVETELCTPVIIEDDST